jgi:uncharacterized membrane protein (DUF106 family)
LEKVLNKEKILSDCRRCIVGFLVKIIGNPGIDWEKLIKFQKIGKKYLKEIKITASIEYRPKLK